jgi:2'-5' RNA ligase
VTQPIILTLQIDERSQAFYDGLRRIHFPANRNLVPAHLTLFHQLPDIETTRQAVEQVARKTASFALKQPALRSLGRGVAVTFQSPEALALHASLSSMFQEWLIPQDRQRFQPHIVVQNKVDADTARQTLRTLEATELLETQALGFILWRYLGGPWEHISSIRFEGNL